MAIECWKCGASLAQVLTPIARREVCPQCETDLHCCRLCRFYDPSVGNACREPVADKVHDKTRANFCGYFEPAHDLGARSAGGGDASGQAARAALDSLFDLQPGEAQGESESERAKRELDRLFGLDEKGSG